MTLTAHAGPAVRVALAIGTFLAVDVVAAGVAPAAEQPACPVGDDPTTVAEVIDGDTVRLGDGRVVRLAGVEAPRRPLGSPESEPWPLAEAARRGLERLAGGKPVRVTTLGARPDRHGRWRVHVHFGNGNEWLQAALVAAGLARVRWLPGDPPCISALLGEEKTARTRALGLWASRDYAVREAGDPSLLARKGLYELVEGRVRSVGHGSSMVFVDFGRDYWRDFTIMASPPVVQRLSERGLAVDRLKGRRIRVRGVIEESGGPAIRLNDPAEIELLDSGED